MYAIADTMIKRFGEREVIALTDRDNLGVVDQVVLAEALDDASAEIDAYLGGRYTVPLDPAPKFIGNICCDIARYRLCGGETQMTDEIRDRYDAGVKFLRLAADGKVTLGTAETGQIAQPENSVQFQTGGRVFGRDVR